MTDTRDLYKDRRLGDGYPGMDRLAHEAFSRAVTSRPDDTPRVETLITHLGRIVDLGTRRNVLVLGCGPHPQPAQILMNKGFRVVGVEPVPSFVETAAEYLGATASVLRGAAESIPVPDASQDIVLFESVLEHVDSIPQSLEEIHRVLAPGGVLYVATTNRFRFSPTGFNGEYNVPFYNWLPALVKEGYVFRHLHYQPSLANYTQRPAVHWMSYADLCRVGRDAGFAQFYATLDLLRPEDPNLAKSGLRRFVLRSLQRNPWLRAWAISQMSGAIFMRKRG